MGYAIVNGTYGSGKTKAEILVVASNDGYWYAVKGSNNANFTYEELKDGVDIETLVDHDAMTNQAGYDYLFELAEDIENYKEEE